MIKLCNPERGQMTWAVSNDMSRYTTPHKVHLCQEPKDAQVGNAVTLAEPFQKSFFTFRNWRINFREKCTKLEGSCAPMWARHQSDFVQQPAARLPQFYLCTLLDKSDVSPLGYCRS